MLTLIAAEFTKTLRLWRTGIGYLAILVVVPLIIWGLASGGEVLERQFLQGLEDQFLIIGSVMNGYTAAVIVMNFLWVHIPFLITLVAGDILSGESVRGTWRVWLTRPPGRLSVLMSKFIIAQAYTVSLVALLGIVSIGVGLLMMGSGDVLVMGNEGIVLLGESWAIPRLALAYFLAMVAMSTVATLAFMVGTFVEHPIGPIVGSMAVIIVLLALSNLPFELFDGVRPWLFTSHFDVWSLALEDPFPAAAIAESVMILAAWNLLFLGISTFVFLRKDMLS
jgi:ABC-2 type transport system permease protein